MPLLPRLEDDQLAPEARAVFEEIRQVRGSDYVNDIWRVLANDPALLARTWSQTRATMAPGALDGLTKEFIYLAASITNDCEYCIRTHTASARTKGMTDAQFAELLAVVGLANQFNRLAAGTRVEVDARYLG